MAQSEPVVVAKQFIMHDSEPLVPSTDLDDMRLQFDTSGRVLVQLTAGLSIEGNGRPAASVSAVEQSAPVFSVPADEFLPPRRLVARWTPLRRRSASLRRRCHSDALEVWNVADNRRQWALTADTGRTLLTLAFSPDGRRLLTQPTFERNAGPEIWQRRAVVWDVETGQPVCDFSPPTTNGAFGEKVPRALPSPPTIAGWSHAARATA